MPASVDRTPRPRTRDELDELVVNIELTLISIIQGIALYFLTDSSRTLIASLEIELWPYVVAGLAVILVFWSRSVIHTLTVIRWPLEFGHNFLYIACTLIEAVMFTQLASAPNWYALGAIYSAAVWLVFAFDLRMIRNRMREAYGPAGRELLVILEQEQLMNVRLSMPLAIVGYALAAAAIHHWPGFFVERKGHLVFGLAQLAGGMAYVIYVIRFFARISPLVLAAREERGGDQPPATSTAAP